MRVLNLFIVLILLVAIGAVVVAFLDLYPIPYLSDFAYGVKGYALAKTPDEALDRFNKALEARNYNMAARYLDGDFQVQMKKNAKVAERMGKAIDNFRSAAKDRALNSDKVEAYLALLEPFPSRISTKDVKESAGGDTAVAVISSESSSRLVPAVGEKLALKKVDGYWRIELPLTPVARARFEEIDRFGQDYVNALDVVNRDMKTDATTKENVFGHLKQKIEEVKKP
jgi:hypothetical protein